MATENYLAMPVLYKAQKVWRYVQLYGPSRTLVKVRGQLHMAATSNFLGTKWENPRYRSPQILDQNIGIIGCGSFSYGNIAYYLQNNYRGCIKGVMDVNPARAKSLAQRYNAAFATTDATEVLNDPSIRLVFVASNHATHAPYAIEALDAGKHVHIEKPHVVNEAQLAELISAMRRNSSQYVFLGFNRPRSRLFARLQEELANENGSAMINWFVAGHEIKDDHWYFSESEGGRILGNLCHWTDLTLHLVGLEQAFPCRVVPVSVEKAKSDFVSSFEFADGSLATITFSAKGHTFEGVRESLNLHKGNVMAEIKDFGQLSITRGATKKYTRPVFRDHGHEANILNSYNGAIRGIASCAESEEHIEASARLFLAVRKAHQINKPVFVRSANDC